ncbi:hypothetical protein DBV15_12687, partial [Temnothorax longispinosus]
CTHLSAVPARRAARIPKEVAADKTGLTGIETALAPSACITGINSARRFQPASSSPPPSPRASSLPIALTRTFAVRRSTRVHHCYKCRSSSHRHSRRSFSGTVGTVTAEKCIVSRKQLAECFVLAIRNRDIEEKFEMLNYEPFNFNYSATQLSRGRPASFLNLVFNVPIRWSGNIDNLRELSVGHKE